MWRRNRMIACLAIAGLFPLGAAAVRPIPAGFALWSYAESQERGQAFGSTLDFTAGDSSLEMVATTSTCKRLSPSPGTWRTQVSVRRTYRPRSTTLPAATFNFSVTSGPFADPMNHPGAQYFAEDGAMVGWGGLSSPLIGKCEVFPASYRENHGIGSYGATPVYVQSFALLGSYRAEVGDPLTSVNSYYVGAFGMTDGAVRWAKAFASPDANGWKVVPRLSTVADHLNRGDGRDEVLVVRVKPTVLPAAAGTYFNYSYYDLWTGALIPPATQFGQSAPP